jgi:hypothetical protein
MSGISTAGFISCDRNAVFVKDREAIQGGLPVLDRHRPSLLDVPKSKVEQFEHGLVVRKRAVNKREKMTP